jgi:branched-chain amino acid transport system ATP-binding protein
MIDSSSMLDARSLTKSFGGLIAIDNFSLSLKEGSITGLIGPNGSGKSTLFNLISGLIKPDSGSIFFQGEKIDKLTPDKRFHLGIGRGFQDPRLFFGMDVFENMLVSPTNQKGENPLSSLLIRLWKNQEIELANKSKNIMKILNIESIALNNSEEISGGQMKLVQLGQLLMNSPKLVLLDEPTAGVSPKLTIEIFDKIKQLRDEENITFLIIEHKLSALFRIVDSVFVMNHGTLFAGGSPDEISANRKLGEIYL